MYSKDSDFKKVDLRLADNQDIKAEEVEKRADYLKKIGFSDEGIERFRMLRPTFFDIQIVVEKIADLKALGFTNPEKMITSSPVILALAIDNIKQKIADLKALSFTNPEKMITSSPSILGYSIGNIKQKIDDLKNLGFTNPEKMITSLPSILALAIDNIKQKIDDLENLGFTNPKKMITSSPVILGYGFENIKQKIEDLKALGFTNPEKMITSLPSILGYSIGNIKQKIDDLKNFGFTNPEKMITFLPPILGYGIENIKQKVKIIEKIFGLYKINLNYLDFIQGNLSVLGTKVDKIWIVARALRALNIEPNKITSSFLGRLLFSNITDLTTASILLVEENLPEVDPKELLAAIKEAKKLSTEDKLLTITTSSLKEVAKLQRRYDVGYGEK